MDSIIAFGETFDSFVGVPWYSARGMALIMPKLGKHYPSTVLQICSLIADGIKCSDT